ILSLAVLALLLVVFRAGMFVGFRKANFSFRWGENYHRNFGGPRGGMMRDFEGMDFIDAQGVSGRIVTMNDQMVVIEGRDGTERVVRVTNQTTIRRSRAVIQIGDLQIDDAIVVLGEPNDNGQIEAKLIRVLRSKRGP
ncbi:hypothetical protein HY624_02775, partial [Candidatus Uhrbacteria bacterium]|nr:hypothetical protein [Candidatus Uhrbacteria bacterium]